MFNFISHSGDCRGKLGRVEMVTLLGGLRFFLEFNMMTVGSRNYSYTPEEDTALQAILISAFLHFSCSSADVLTHKGRSDT